MDPAPQAEIANIPACRKAQIAVPRPAPGEARDGEVEFVRRCGMRSGDRPSWFCAGPVPAACWPGLPAVARARVSPTAPRTDRPAGFEHSPVEGERSVRQRRAGPGFRRAATFADRTDARTTIGSTRDASDRRCRTIRATDTCNRIRFRSGAIKRTLGPGPRECSALSCAAGASSNTETSECVRDGVGVEDVGTCPVSPHS
jgi:hypothetical protein